MKIVIISNLSNDRSKASFKNEDMVSNFIVGVKCLNSNLCKFSVIRFVRCDYNHPLNYTHTHAQTHTHAHTHTHTHTPEMHTIFV